MGQIVLIVLASHGYQGLLRRRGQRREARQGRRPAHRGELPRSVYRREGVRLQGLVLPPRHPQLHVPGRRLHRRKRHRGQVDLRHEVRGRELHPEAHRPRHPLHGQRRPQHQRQPVLLVHRQDLVARRQTRRLRTGRRGHGHCQEDRVLRLPERQDVQEDHHLRLRHVLGRRRRNQCQEEKKREKREEALRQLYRWFQLYQLHHWINGFLSVLRAPSPAVPQTPQPRRRLYLPLTQNKGIFSALLQFDRRSLQPKKEHLCRSMATLKFEQMIKIKSYYCISPPMMKMKTACGSAWTRSPRTI